MRFIVVAVLLLTGYSFSFAQTTGEFRSFQTGDWDQTSSWERWSGAAWVNPAPSTPTNSTAATVTIRNGHQITVDAAVSTDQTVIQSGGSLVISGVTLTIASGAGTDLNINAGGSLTNNGTLALSTTLGFNVQVSGDLTSSGSINNANASRLTFNSGSNYYHNFSDAGTIPTASWNANSTVNIIGYSGGGSTAPSGLSQTFGNFVWNCPGQDATIDLGGAPSDVNGDFTITDTGVDVLLYNFGSGANVDLSIGGDLTMSNGIFGFTAAVGTPAVLTVTGNIDVSGGFLQFADDDDLALTVGGDFILSNGQVEFSASTATTTFDLTGDFNQSGGDVFVSGGVLDLNFVSGGVQNYISAFVPTGTLNYNVDASTTLVLAASDFVAGSGTFASSGTVQVASTDASGAIQTGTAGGNIRVSGSRTFSSGSTIEYNGAAAQFIGNGHSGSAGVHTIINNASGVTLVGSRTIGGNLTLTDGDVTVGANTLTLLANVTANGNTIVTSSTSSITIQGSGAFGTFPFPSGDQTLTNFTISRSSSGTVTFGNNITITGVLALTNGSIIFDNQTLTISGTITRVSGTLSGNTSSTFYINGSGALGSFAFATGGNTINTLTMDRASGTASLNTTLIITNELNLIEGDFTNTIGLTLEGGATVTRNATAQLLGSAIAIDDGEYYNVVYENGDMNTGIELPEADDDDLMSLTIGSGVTLTKDIIVNGDVTLQNSDFNSNGFDITMAGASATWSKVNGTFTPSTGTVTVTGNMTVTGTNPRFGNLTVDNAATLTAPSGTLLILGNFQVDAGSTFNHNNGRITFNGSATQGFAGAAKTYNNIRVNKTGGNLQLLSGVNLIGELHIQTATQVESNGSLTLISTSDGTSGNAYVAELATGASITGDVTAQRYMSSEGRIYRYISSPVSGATVATLQDDFPVTGAFTGTSYPCTGCTNAASMFYYNETATGSLDNGYVNFPTTTSAAALTVGLGYVPFIRQDIVAGPITIDVTGTLNQGTIALPVTYTSSAGAANDGWNLVGNPYPASIDWDIVAGWTKINISNSIAVRDNGSGGVYQYWNGTTGGLANGIIAAGQGFWVQANAASPVLSVTEQAKTTSTGTFYREAPVHADVLEIAMRTGVVTDRAYFQLDKDALTGFDPLDARKLDNVSFDLSIFTSDGLLAINAVNKKPRSGESIKLRIKDMPRGTYHFTLNKLGKMQNYEYFLLDRFAKKTIDMQVTETYVFSVTTASASLAADRFELFMYRIDEEEDSTDLTTFAKATVHPNPSSGRVYVQVNSTGLQGVYVLNPQGNSLMEVPMVRINEDHYEGWADISDQPAGLYVIRVMDNDGKTDNLKILKR